MTKPQDPDGTRLKRLEQILHQAKQIGRYPSRNELSSQLGCHSQWLSNNKRAIELYRDYCDVPRIQSLTRVLDGLRAEGALIDKNAIAQKTGIGIAWLSSNRDAIELINQYLIEMKGHKEPTPERLPEIKLPAVEPIPDAISQEIKALKAMLSTNNGEVTALQAQLQALRAQAGQAQKDADQARAQVSELVAMVKEKDLQIEKLRSQIDSNPVSVIRQITEQLSAQIEIQQEALDAANKLQLLWSNDIPLVLQNGRSLDPVAS